MDATEAQHFDAQGMVICDRACRRCGYNLRGLHREGRCPECGRPVGLSFEGDLLRFADPDWVETLARGSRLVIIGLGINIVSGLVTLVVTVSVNALAPMRTPPLLELLTGLCLLAGLVGTAVLYIGVWLATRPDPTRIGEDIYARSRKLVRVMLLAGIVSTALSLVLDTLPTTMPVVELVVLPLIALGELGALIGAVTYVWYLGRLALRIPDDQLAKRARIAFWGLIITAATAAGLALINGVLAAIAGSGALLAPLGCLLPLGALVAFGFVLLALRVQYRIRDACREQAALARQTWAAAEPAKTAQ